jgi:hypothetical protein
MLYFHTAGVKVLTGIKSSIHLEHTTAPVIGRMLISMPLERAVFQKIVAKDDTG